MATSPSTRFVGSGVCVGQRTLDVESCALEPSQCPPGTVFRSHAEAKLGNYFGRDDGQLLCPVGKMPIGRCASDADSHTCMPDASSCAEERLYTPPETAGCSVGHDLRADEEEPTFSYYPACMTVPKPGVKTEHVCRWSTDDCLEVDEQPIVGRTYGWDCTCELVETGACKRDGYTDPNYLDELYCAVSEDACDESSSWIHPRDLRTDYDVDCRLCDPDLVYNQQQYEVVMGACMLDETLVRCAAEDLQCPPGTVYHSAWEIRGLVNSEAEVCRSKRADQIQGGRCRPGLDDDDETCTNYGTACHSPRKFNSDDETCSLVFDTLNHDFAKYATCSNPPQPEQCRWTGDQCPEGWGSFLPHQGECTCEKVRTGACLGQDGGLACAVSENACASGDERYIAVEELFNQYDKDCRLCPASLVKSKQWNKSEDLGMTLFETERFANSPTAETESSINIPLVVGLTCICATLVVLFVVGLVFRSKRRRNDTKKEKQFKSESKGVKMYDEASVDDVSLSP